MITYYTIRPLIFVDTSSFVQTFIIYTYNTCFYRVPLHLLQLSLQAIGEQCKEFFEKKKIILSSPSVLYHMLAIYPKLANKPQVQEALTLLLS